MREYEVPPELFSDPAGADKGIQALHEMFIRSGSRFPLRDFSASLVRGLKASTDPDLALTGFLRFVGAGFGGAALFNDLLQYTAYNDLLFSIFGHSRYFTDVLVREPVLFRWLTATNALTAPVRENELEEETGRLLETFRRPEKCLDALKRLHRRELLRIGAQDILGVADLSSATAQLSVLADAVVRASLTIAVNQTAPPVGGSPEGPFCVIGLGKYGGNELNYSSDIDIIFVYGERRGGSEEDAAAAHAFFNKLAERLVRNLSQPSSEGHLYRVDTRLRPNAGAGPLALSTEAYLAHYESRGALWERQMLIKARPVAGDLRLGKQFLGMLEPFIYPRAMTEHPAASVGRIKARIEAEVGDEPNIKLMAGGIRDIEFIAQTLQLINGGAVPAIRLPNTLDALAALEANGFLTGKEHTTLRGAYTLYRTVEHRLQMMLNTQRHTLPEHGREFDVLGRRSGLKGGAELRRALDTNLAAVRGIFDQVLGGGEKTRAVGIGELLSGLPDDSAFARAAGAMGFRDVPAAARNLRLLARGGAPAGMPGPEARAREALATAAPLIFQAVVTTPDPDLTLASLTLLASAQAVPHLFYTQMGDRRYRKLILDICAVSPRFARELGRLPLVLELIASDPEVLAHRPDPALPPAGEAAAFKSRLELLAGIRHLLGFTDFDELTGEISAIAYSVVRGAFASLRRRRKSLPPLAVFALGKFGTEELGYDADLDLLFVGREAGGSSGGELEALAARVLKGVTATASGERLYEADVRLRPEGKNAPLVVEAGSYAKYLATRASLWERQSLTRLRFVAGDPAVGGYVTSLVSAWVYEAPLPAGWTESIVAMRRTMETRSRTRGGSFIDLKLGPGGMADVEFIVQMIQLKFGKSDSSLRSGKIVATLKGGAVPAAVPGDRAFLASAYAMYRRIELLIRLGLEERGSVMPEGEKLDRLARLYDGSSGAALESRIAATMKRVRGEFLELAAFLEKWGTT